MLLNVAIAQKKCNSGEGMITMTAVRKLVIFYFSGTGNARQIALWFAEAALKNGMECKTFNIAKTDLNALANIASDACILIISPIHGFNYPKITLDFISHFPRGTNPVVVMATRGGMKIGTWVTPGLTGIAFLLSSCLLKRKGYTIKGMIAFDMPSNWISIHPALRAAAVNFIHRVNYERVQQHATQLFSGKSDFHALRDLLQDLLIAPVSLAYYLAGRFMLAKSFYAAPSCDGCGVCIQQCPVQAIKSIRARPFWTFRCESCMKCMNVCPKQSVETAHGLFVVVSVLCSAILSTWVYSRWSHDLPAGAFRFIASNLVFFALLWGAYRLQHVLLRHKFFGKLISYTSLTHYKFWGRYKSIPDHQWKK